MKKNKFFLGLATIVAALTFASCSSDEPETTPQPEKARTISFTTSLAQTRATSDPQGETSLSTSSSLAIWAINQSGSSALTNGNNEQYSVDGSGNLTPTTAANTMTWPDDATLDFYAYAPYNNSYAYNSANTFSVAADQSTEANYLASDLVLAQATNKTYSSETPVALSFKHLMSKINITINKASGASVDLSKAKVTITNTKLKTSFKPSATDGSEDKILTEVSTDNEAADIIAVSALGDATTACAIIVPQTISAGTALVKIETGSEATSGANRTMIAKLANETTFASGQAYNFTVTVSDATTPTVEVALELGSSTLVKWEDNNLGASTTETYVIGDYILNDGTFLKASSLASASDDVKNKISAVIFSTTSHDTGWDGYAVSVCGKKASQTWQSGDNITASILGSGSAITTTEDACADYTGLTVTKAAKEANYTSAFSFDNYKNDSNFPGKNISSGLTAGTISDWFMPSFGQMMELFTNLGGATIEISGKNLNGSGELADENKPTNGYSIITAINTHKVSENISIIEAVDYCTTTQSATDKMWLVKLNGVTSESTSWNISSGAAKTGSNRNVLPIIAFKQPTE